jgi:Flp pilus assembly protein TadD
MQHWLAWWCFVCFFCIGAWAQQKPDAPSASSPSASSSSAPGAQNGEADQAQDQDPNKAQEGSPAASPASNSISDSAKNPESSGMTPPRSDRVQIDDLPTGTGESSSKDTQTDLSPPADDAKAHPQSSDAVAKAEDTSLSGGITEFHTWDPHKAAKDIEVGDFYFRRKNYRAAEDRYREALTYKDNDAIATIKLAECLEKLGILDDARAEYESYLRILPHGPEANQAQKAINRLKAQTTGLTAP